MEAETQRLNAALRNVGAAGAAAGSKIATGLKPANDAIDEGKKKAESFTISWQTLGRIVMTQMIVRAMSQIRDALHEAVQASIEFQQHIAEIQTIAPQIGGTFTSLTSEAAEFAKQFNIPLAQSTEGLYQTISNQFTGVSQRANVMAAAVKLARVGVMDFQSAIMLLTGTLNAYGMADSQAEAAASKFFTTIRLGRVRGKELADTMGQVMPIASELGVNLDELNSAMVAMTIGGMDAHKTVTGLRGAMTGFLKPSEDMKKVLRELGFASAEQLIQAKGFQGALQAVADASGDMASEIAKSFRNVRALTAELRLTGEGAKQVEEAMKAMEASTPEALDKVFKQFTSTDAEKLTSQINAAEDQLDPGFRLRHHSRPGEHDAVGRRCRPPFGRAPGDCLRRDAGCGRLGRLGNGLYDLRLHAGAGGLDAHGHLGGARAVHWRQDLLDGPVDQRDPPARASRARGDVAVHQGQGGGTAEAPRGRREEDGGGERSLGEPRGGDPPGLLQGPGRPAREEQDDHREQPAGHAVDGRRAGARGVRLPQCRQRRPADRAGIAEPPGHLGGPGRRPALQGTAEEAESRARSRRRWLPCVEAGTWKSWPTKRSPRRRARTTCAARKAIQQRAKAYLDEGTALAGQTQNTWLQYQAERSVLYNLDAQIKAEKQLETLQATRAQKLADEAAKEQKRLDEMKTLMKAILTDLEAFDKQGAKSPKELAEQQKRLNENIGKFREEWLGGKKADVADLLAFDQLQRRVTMAIEGGVSEAEVKELYAAPETFAKFRADIEKGVGPVRLMIEWMRLTSPEIWKATEGMTRRGGGAVHQPAAQNAAETIKQVSGARRFLGDRPMSSWNARGRRPLRRPTVG